jgi:CubicO group peptidase (beta-lactamase class C family)
MCNIVAFRLTIFMLISLCLAGNLCSQENYIESVRERDRLVGLTYAVFTSERVLEVAAAGKRRIDADSLVRTTDRFHIGSNTKAVTSFIAAKLVELRKLRWDTRYFDLFPELKSGSRPEYWNITLQDLLCHRAGINPYRSVNANQDAYKIAGNSVEQKIRFAERILKEMPAKPDAGQVYVYSNAGVSLAASMIEKVSGKTWEELVGEYLNKQLKLDFEVGFPYAADPTQPWGHILNDGKILALGPDFDYHVAEIMRPAGDLNVSIIDYIRFVQLFLKGYKGENNFLSARTYRYLLTAEPDYSFGWANKVINGKNYDYHSGSAATFGAFTKIERDDDLAVIVMTNYGDDKALKSIATVADFLLQKYSAEHK